MTDQGPGDRQGQDRPAPNSVEQEAHRLVRAAAEWWHARGEQAPPGQPAAGEAQPESDDATSAVPCTGCPWCRAKARFGPVGADAALGFADLLGSAADSLRAYAQAQGSREQRQAPGAGPAEEVEDPRTGGGQQPGPQP